MKIDRVFAIYFSPTDGTKTYVEAIARSLSDKFSIIDLTKPENREKEHNFSENDLAIIGAPVYAGRLPVVEKSLFSNLKGKNTPAIFNVSYGNRAFEDALLEEKEICEAQGFIGIAGAAWIAPHSFSDKIAANRPDKTDELKILEFANKVSELLKSNIGQAHSLKVPGNSPYKELKALHFYPEASEICTDCGICALICPNNAILPDNFRSTNPKKCISCLACIKNCPTKARNVNNPMFLESRQKLETMLMSMHREAEFFF